MGDFFDPWDAENPSIVFLHVFPNEGMGLVQMSEGYLGGRLIWLPSRVRKESTKDIP